MNVIFKRTKILATVGPSIDSEEQLKTAITTGVNGFRLNFSHESPEAADRHIAMIRAASQAAGKPVAILQDLQGPKIRLGVLKTQPLLVKVGDELTLDYAAEHDGGFTLPVQYNLATKVEKGQPLHLFDGKIRTTITGVISDTAITVKVENDGELFSKKGINLPDTDFGGDIITEKDIADITYGAEKDIDYVALSFVQSVRDVYALRQLLTERGSEARIIAKVETKAAIEPETLEAIVRESDGVMVARGDLAVEVGAEVVPIIQRRIIALCRKHGKLSIVATQMMASMTDNPEPTRAEVSDVATAVVLGTDAVMLSDETAMGKFPLEAVAAMKKVIVYTQEHTPPASISEVLKQDIAQRTAISAAAVKLAEELGVNAIVAETKSGATARDIAAFRPNLPIVSVTSVTRTAQQLALRYGNKSFVRPDGEKAGLELATQLKEDGFFGTTAPVKIVIVSGRQPGVIGATDTIRVRVIQ
ncbi:pyruvate kinase [Candidatus Saccharibacteria bacterium RAAC3_TM7_1]|nr:pyruvate kinase [Candidatus Saccharibacteria bacterium RAAC3_TM7_1]HCZ28201.1 pyruvate kinase [Candidatus Saccharibacteria bacterium]